MSWILKLHLLRLLLNRRSGPRQGLCQQGAVYPQRENPEVSDGRLGGVVGGGGGVCVYNGDGLGKMNEEGSVCVCMYM